MAGTGLYWKARSRPPQHSDTQIERPLLTAIEVHEIRGADGIDNDVWILPVKYVIKSETKRPSLMPCREGAFEMNIYFEELGIPEAVYSAPNRTLVIND